MKLVALLQARNEARYLPGWLANVAPAVDGIIALDDRSDDETGSLLRAHPKVIDVITKLSGDSWDERGNHIALIRAAREHRVPWAISIDADERLEQEFAVRREAVIEAADRDGIEALSLQLRELWGDRAHYRSDGIWRGKARYRLFRNRREHTKFDPRPLHRYWIPLDIVANLARVGRHLDLNIYHLSMISRDEREARHARYRALDPDGRFQPQGYDYLVDETGLERTLVPPDRDFLPADDPAAMTLVTSRG